MFTNLAIERGPHIVVYIVWIYGLLYGSIIVLYVYIGIMNWLQVGFPCFFPGAVFLAIC